jgi:hypothetical protein
MRERSLPESTGGKCALAEWKVRCVLAGRDLATWRSTAFLGDARDDRRLGIGDVVLWRFVSRISTVQRYRFRVIF